MNAIATASALSVENVHDDVHSLPNLDGYDSIIWDIFGKPFPADAAFTEYTEESARERHMWKRSNYAACEKTRLRCVYRGGNGKNVLHPGILFQANVGGGRSGAVD